VPDPLKRQLKIGGSLVMPIGAPGDLQNLFRITRESEESWAQENLGPVRFVPLIGAEGWRE
jgi:protein-L-isoaspartate(D-aspartate) O-methyltransferase